MRLLEESLRHNFLPVQVYYSPSDLTERGIELVRRFQQAEVLCVSVSRKEIAQFADTETPQGIIARFEEPKHNAEEFLGRKNLHALLLDNISDPGNAGTLIRSALAFGFEMVLNGPGTVDDSIPKRLEHHQERSLVCR